MIKTKLTFLSWGLLILLLGSIKAKAEDLIFLAQDSQPKYLMQNGQVGGLCGEIYHALQSKLQARHISSELPSYYVPIKRIFKLLEEGDHYVFCGANHSPDRETRFKFAPQPVYQVSYVLAAHVQDNDTPHTFQDILNGQGVVGALYGTQSSRYLKSQLKGRVNDSFTDIISGLTLIEHAPDRLRYFYYHDLGLNYVIKEHKLSLKVLKAKLKASSQWLIYSKNLSPEIAQALEASLNELESSGALATIGSHYIY